MLSRASRTHLPLVQLAPLTQRRKSVPLSVSEVLATLSKRLSMTERTGVLRFTPYGRGVRLIQSDYGDSLRMSHRNAADYHSTDW